MKSEMKIHSLKKKHAFQFKPTFQIGRREIIYQGEAVDYLNNSEVITNVVDNSINEGAMTLPFQKSEHPDHT